MSQFTKYPNLPGLLVEFKDGGMKLEKDPIPPVTGSMLILGTATDGPVGEPVKVDPEYLNDLFGVATDANGIHNGASLVASYEAAYQLGCRDIRLMRISGSEAEVELQGEQIVETEEKIMEERVGVVEGNDETLFQLNVVDAIIVEESVIVYADGKEIDALKFSFDSNTNSITVSANATNANANVTIVFAYKEEEAVVEELQVLLSNSNIVTLTKTIKDESQLAVEDASGTIIDPSKYVLNGLELDFSVAIGESLIVEEDIVTIAYEGFTGVETPVTQNDDDAGVSLMLETGLQVFSLSEVPKVSSIILYENDKEVLSSESFLTDTSAKTISLKKEFFSIGSDIDVRYAYDEENIVIPTIKLSSYFGGKAYNEGSIETVNILDDSEVVIGKKIVITKPEGKKAQVAEKSLEYSTLNYPTFKLLVDAITNDRRNGVYKAETNFGKRASSELTIKNKTFFAKGEDGLGLSKQTLFEKLSGKRNEAFELVEYGAYQLLEDYTVDYVVPADVYLDDELVGKNDNFAYELGMFLSFVSYRTSVTVGAIAAKPITDTSLLGKKQFVNKLVGISNVYEMLDPQGNKIMQNGATIDLGKFMSTVVGPETVMNLPSVRNFEVNPAVIYMALETVLEPQSSTTNKELKNVSLRYELSNAQLDKLTGARLVTFKTKTDGSVRVIDGVTAAKPGSDYSRINTADVIKTAIEEIRDVAQPYLGEPNSVEQRNALSAAISKRLTALKEGKVIQDYSFGITASLQDQLIGQAKIDLTIVPPQELRRITTTVALKPAI